MSNSDIHCCVKSNCTGERYGKWSLNCKFCGNKIFIQCLRKRDEFTKTILAAFGLGEFDSSGFFGVKTDNPSGERVFYKAFNVQSPFAITCETCTEKFNKILVENRSKNTHTVENNVVSNSREIPNLKSSGAKPRQSMVVDKKSVDASNVGKTEDEYAIYVSQFHPSVNCNDIVNLILSNTNIEDSNLFSVTKLLKRKVNMKIIHFVSFKIATSNQQIYSTILDKKIWEPEFTAIPFDFDRPKKAKHPVKLQNSRKPTKSSSTNSNVTKTANPKRTVSSNKRESPKLNTGNQINKPVRKSSGPTQRSKRVVPYSIPAQIPHPIPHPVAYQGAMLHPVTYQAPLMPHSNFHQWGTQLPHHRAFQSPWFQPYPHLPY